MDMLNKSSSSSSCAIVHRRAREASVALNNTAVSLLSRHNYKEAIDTFRDALDMMRSSFHEQKSPDDTEEGGNIVVIDQESMKVDNDEQEANETITASNTTTPIPTTTTTTTTTSTAMTSTSTSQCNSTLIIDRFRQVEVNKPLHKASLLLARSSSATKLTENIHDAKSSYDLIELADDMNANAVKTKLHQIEEATTEAKCCSSLDDNDTSVITDPCFTPTPNMYHVVRIHSSTDDDFDNDDVENAIIEIPVSNIDLDLALILLNYGVACRIYAIECMDESDQSSKTILCASQLIGLAHDIICNVDLNELDERNIIKFTLLSTLILQNLIQICFQFQMNEECFHIYFVQIKKLRILLDIEIKENWCSGAIASLSYDQRAAAAA